MTADHSPVYARPSAEVKAAALAGLAGMEEPRWSMDTLIVTFLAAFGRRPSEMLALIAPDKPPKRDPGRPRKAEPIAESASTIPDAPKPASKKPAPKKRAEPVAPTFTSPATPDKPADPPGTMRLANGKLVLRPPPKTGF